MRGTVEKAVLRFLDRSRRGLLSAATVEQVAHLGCKQPEHKNDYSCECTANERSNQ
jgi:hypothetical protein